VPEFKKDMTKRQKIEHLMALLDEQPEFKAVPRTKVLKMKSEQGDLD
jgi:hypothetical protein